jgi:LEA14-like dessication related protein
MRRSIEWIGFVTLLIAGCASLPGGIEPLSVTLSDIVPAQMGLIEQEYAVKIRVQNPNSIDFPLAGLSYDLELNGKPFAKGVGKADATVPAFGDVVVEGKAISTLSGILNQVSALRGRVPEKFSYRLIGKLSALDGRSIPFDQKGEVELAGLLSGDK